MEQIIAILLETFKDIRGGINILTTLSDLGYVNKILFLFQEAKLHVQIENSAIIKCFHLKELKGKEIYENMIKTLHDDCSLFEIGLLP